MTDTEETLEEALALMNQVLTLCSGKEHGMILDAIVNALVVVYLDTEESPDKDELLACVSHVYDARQCVRARRGMQ